MKPKIKEVIVVEGKDDISAVKKAVDAQIIKVNGFSVRNRATLDKIKFASEKKGAIILTDPDFAGDKIRKIIENYVPGIKHAYISRENGRKKNNIGIENAAPTVILTALKNAKCKICNKREEFSIIDMIENGLSIGNNSKINRQNLGDFLNIGYSNTKQFLSKLNDFEITREKFNEELKKTVSN